MLTFFNCKPFDEARQIMASYLTGCARKSEYISLQDALGRVSAEDIMASEDIPPFNRSTVDGYAVRSGDTFGAGEANPVWLTVQGEIAMGCPAAFEVLPGQAAVIPTGGMLPAGSDSIVMLEHTETTDNGKTVFINKPAAPGENVIVKGEDMESGSVLVGEGTQIAPPAVGALAACGIDKLRVYRRVEAAVISTGDELVPVSRKPAHGEIRDINSYSLAAALTAAGCQVTCLGVVKDNYQDVLAALTKAVSNYQLVLISGGSSVGERDHTAAAIDALGSPGVLFHGLAVKPGKPTIFGLVGAVPVFGLPGHPVAAMTICEQLVLPAIDLLAGRMAVRKRICRARLTKNVASAPGRDDFIKVRLIQQGNEFLAEPILGKSGLISTLLRADGIVRVDFHKSGLYKDEAVDVVIPY